MSKLETPMTRWYWKQIGGTLVEEFKVVSRSKNTGQRLIDGVIILDGPNKIAHWKDVDLTDKDIVIVQTKNSRLGMYLMGQAFFSVKLIEPFKPKSIKSVALCTKYDDVLGPIFEAYDGMEVVVCPDEIV